MCGYQDGVGLFVEVFNCVDVLDHLLKVEERLICKRLVSLVEVLFSRVADVGSPNGVCEVRDMARVSYGYRGGAAVICVETGVVHDAVKHRDGRGVLVEIRAVGVGAVDRLPHVTVDKDVVPGELLHVLPRVAFVLDGDVLEVLSECTEGWWFRPDV